MLRIRSKHLYAEIDRHGHRDESGRVARKPFRGPQTRLIIKGYVIDFGDSASIELLAGERGETAHTAAAV